MKIIHTITIVLFAAIIAVPLIFFNTEPHSVSVIDNRTLTENPLQTDGDLTTNIQNYVNDRIGLRDDMITAYTVFNDKIFGKMVHPSYTYGKDEYVFGAGLTTYNSFGDFHIAFADMVLEIQTYCEDRGVPFLFVFNPAKPAIYQDKIADGVNYNREWVPLFFEELDKRDINYLDNTETMLSLRESGIDGFNQKYDANHWNDIGAFYGTQKMLERLQESCPNVHVNQLEEFNVSETRKESLLVSEFPINEMVPYISLKSSPSNLYDTFFPVLDINESFPGFGYYINAERTIEDTPKLLVFQGSYMNSYGYKYFANAFEEYIHVHDYQNVINFPYYFNIFQPECVIFEVAEYTFSGTYFNYENMCAINYNPALSILPKNAYQTIDSVHETFTIDIGDVLTTIFWSTNDIYQYVWLTLDRPYDMHAVEGGYLLTIETKSYESFKDSMQLTVSTQ